MSDIRISTAPVTLDGSKQKIQVITFDGQLDESNADDQSQKVYDIIQNNAEGTSYIFDLSPLSYLNSKAIGYMSDFYHRIVNQHGKLILAAPRKNIFDIFEVVGIVRLIPIVGSVEEAKVKIVG